MRTATRAVLIVVLASVAGLAALVMLLPGRTDDGRIAEGHTDDSSDSAPALSSPAAPFDATTDPVTVAHVSTPAATAPPTASNPIAPHPAASQPTPVAPPVEPEQLGVEYAYLYPEGLNVGSTGKLLKGDDFDRALDQLVEQGARSAQVADIAELYRSSAQAASDEVAPDVRIRRLVCGMKICFLAASAASTESFDVWLDAFRENPVARVYAGGRHDKTFDNGVIEYRMVFSTDPEQRSAVIPTN